jgi:uncharacterized protein YxjI
MGLRDRRETRHDERETFGRGGTAQRYQMRQKLYEIEADGHKIAEVSKKWFRVRDTYGVEIAPAENRDLVLAVTVAVDTMAHPSK